MSLGLNIDNLAGPGRKAAPLVADHAGDLTQVDLELLATSDRGIVAPDIKRVTDRHHAMARLLASGMSPGDVAATLGMSNSRVSIIQQSPAFQDLLKIYRDEVDYKFTSLLDHMAGLSKDAMDELRERMEEAPDDFSNRELITMITELGDRARDNSESVNKPVVIELVGPDE
jgi:hypothetical protein